MKQILCFGDSNTWGLIPKTKQRYPCGVRWTSILDNELNRHFNNEYRVIEEALTAIERENERLKGILPKNFASPELDKRRLGDVVDLLRT